MRCEPANDINEFWADRFDVDLLQLFPYLREKIGPVADARVWVLGSLDNDGVTFSHPTCWNGYRGLQSFFWADEPPDLNRDSHGWVRLDGGFQTQDLLCCLTVIQAIRDCWSHSYDLFLEGKKCLINNNRFFYSHFYPIMAARRGWETHAYIDQIMYEVQRWAIQGAKNMQVIIEAKRLELGRQFPYFARQR